jgi:predicted nucleic acid-binding protein
VTAIVVDASAMAAALMDGGDLCSAARDTLAGRSLAAPHLIDLEIASTLRRAVLSGRLDALVAERGLVGVATLPGLIRYPHAAMLARIWELRENITSYDGAYVALAELLELPLVTVDRRLAKAAARYCDVVTIEA